MNEKSTSLFSRDKDGNPVDDWIWEELLDGDANPDPYRHDIGAKTLSYRDKLASLITLEWDEGQHPRDEGGKFTDGGGSTLSSEERHEVIRLYTQSGGRYREVNEHLREGREADDKTKQTLEVMDRLFDEEGEPVTGALYRGMAGYEPEELGLEEGKEFTDKGFVSTTGTRAVANRFAAANHSGKIEGEHAVGIIFKINAKGAKGVSLSGYSRYGEDETLLPRGTTFKITNIKEGYPGESFSIVTMTVVKK